MATIWDADVLIWAASPDRRRGGPRLPTSRFFRFTPYQLLIAIGRGPAIASIATQGGAAAAAIDGRPDHDPSGRELAPTAVLLDQRMGGADRSRTAVPGHGIRAAGVVLPGRPRPSLVLTIDPAYFALTGGIERWLYRVARNHAGHQPKGWAFELRHLHAKRESARFSDFALDMGRIVARQPLPGYRLDIDRHDGRELILIRPNPSTVPVDNLCNSSAAIGTSGANGIGIPGASLSGFRRTDFR